MAQTSRPSDPFRKRLNAFTKAARHLDKADVKAVHFTRVASRRLREVLPVVGLPADAVRKLNRRLKKITTQLGVVRELDVLTEMLEELDGEARYPSNALKQIGDAIEKERVAAQDRMTERLPFQKLQRLSRRLRRAAKKIESRVLDPHWNMPPVRRAWTWAIDARASRRAATLATAIESAGSVYAPERLHDVRLAVKRLRYALELRAEARKLRATRDTAALKAAQDLLGRLHDVEILIARARETQTSLSPSTLTVWRELDTLTAALEDDCRVLHARYMHERARLTAIADRVQDRPNTAPPASRRAAS